MPISGCVLKSSSAMMDISPNCLGDGLLVYFGYPQAHEDEPKEPYVLGWVFSMPWET